MLSKSAVLLPSKDEILVEQFENFKDSLGDKVFDDEFTNILSQKPNKDLALKWKDFKWTRLVDLK